MKRIKPLNILPPTLLLGLSAFLSSLLGVFRDRLLAKTFGATSGQGIYNSDAYYAAFKIPDLLYFILVSGAVSVALVPLFTQYKKKKQMGQAWQYANNMLHLLLLTVSAFALLIFIFAPQFTRLVAPGFEPELFDLTVRLMRIMLLSPILFTFSAVFMSLQDSFKTFFFRALGPIFYNVGIIISILFFAEEWGVIGVTWGVILGALLTLLVQLPALRLVGFKHRWVANFRAPDVRQSFRLMMPRVLSTSMYQISQLIYTQIASFLTVGSISILYYANNLYALPLGIVAVSFSVTSFATFSEFALEKNTQLFADEIKRVMQQVLFLVLPATVGMLLLRDPIIEVILLTGKFTVEDASLTSNVLFVLLFSLFTHSLNLLLVRGFFAYHDTKTPFYANLIGALFGIILAYFLSGSLGIVGIAIGISFSNILTFIFLYFWMRQKVQHPLLNVVNVLKISISSVVMGGGVYLFQLIFKIPDLVWTKVLYLILLIFVGLLLYLLMAHCFKIPERQMLLKQFRRIF